jgi:hypothetical protein
MGDDNASYAGQFLIRMALPVVISVLFSSREMMHPRVLAQLMADSLSIAFARRILLSRLIYRGSAFPIVE